MAFPPPSWSSSKTVETVLAEEVQGTAFSAEPSILHGSGWDICQEKQSKPNNILETFEDI